jgi:hypothetical protein
MPHHWAIVRKLTRVGALTIAELCAARLDGLVVIELERYRSDRDCSDDNDMTWWILP